MKDDFDEKFYLGQGPDISPGLSAQQHYLQSGAREPFDPSAEFSNEYYLRRYKDIKLAGINPLVHYLKHGRSEGRAPKPDFRKWMRPGKIVEDHGRTTILVACHEASRTGAPLLGLELVRELGRSYNVITFLFRGGELVDDFVENSILVIVAELDRVDYEFLLEELKAQHRLSSVICNSVESHAIAQASLFTDLPTLALVHEFAEYCLPRGKLADLISAADRVVVPAALLMESAQKEMLRYFGTTATNITIQAQGYLPKFTVSASFDLTADEILDRLRPGKGARPRIVFGAGSVQMRKGVDLFIETAAQVCKQSKEDICFVWVGEGYIPDTDINYSVWLRETVERQGLKNNVFFFPAQQSLEAFFQLADVFYLSSRMDPFPNVVVDALQAGKPVVCFDKATGVAEFFRECRAVGAAVEYADVVEAAKAILAALDADPNLARANTQLVATAFDFGRYVSVLETELERARRARKELIESRDRIATANIFDAAFHGAEKTVWFSQRYELTSYVARGTKGLARFNPRPGFNEGLYRAKLDASRALPGAALDLELRQRGRVDLHPVTHVCNIVGGARGGGRIPEGGAALHIHLHYADLAPLFVQRLIRLEQRVDLFITTTSLEKCRELEQVFSSYRLGRVQVTAGPNRGRDLGPFLISVADSIRRGGYGLVGHLHGKKSLPVGQALGEKWRTFLLNTLLGDTAQVGQIFDLFAEKETLGLLFPEDRHSVGWSANRTQAEQLAMRLGGVQLPVFPVFPIGTMFWARPAALEPLWRADFSWADFPTEPVPYDGTILHAIERMLPAICESAGYEWETLYNSENAW